MQELGLSFDEDIRPGIRPVDELRPLNPNLALPVLRDGEDVLFGSNLIIEYLFSRYEAQAQTTSVPLARTLAREECRWRDLKILTTIETFADTLVNVRHFRSEGASAATSRYMARQEARMEACLDWLEEQATPQGFWPGVFSAMDIAMICPLDYGENRRLIQWRGRPKLAGLYQHWQGRPSVAGTAEPLLPVKQAV